VSNLCAGLHRAYRDLRFYPVDHPVALQTLEVLTAALLGEVNTSGSITLEVEEDRLLYQGEQVYSYETSRDNVAFLMFRDGVRSLSFHSGLEEAEVRAFVDCLAHADDLINADHDLLTAFWEQDFGHIDYRAADPFLGGEVLKEGTVDALRETVLRRLDEVALGGQDKGDSQVDLRPVASQAMDMGRLRLTRSEVERTEREAADPGNAFEAFAVVLLELAGHRLGHGSVREAGWISQDDALARSLGMVVDTYMRGQDLDWIETVVARLRVLEAGPGGTDGFSEAVMATGVSAQALKGLIEGAGQGTTREAARVERLLLAMRSWIIGPLLEVLADTEDRGARKVALDVLQAEGGVPAAHLEPLFLDPRWYVVRNAVQLAAGSRDPEMPVRLGRLGVHGDARVRREVMRTLDTLGSAGGLQVLTRALVDEDPSVRILAVRALGRQGGRDHEVQVLAQIESRDFEGRTAEEMEAFLRAFAALAGDRAVPVLDRLWRRKRLLNRPLALRLAAVSALGSMPSPAADAVLTAAAASTEVQVQRTALRARQEAQALRRTSSA